MNSCLRAESVRRWAICALNLLLFTGCEEPFEPLAPSDLAFSIYGHLDAAVDTQWVRIIPVRESLETPSGPIDAIVTLEEIETGATVVMSDSLFRYQPLFGDAAVYAHNFSTTMRMVPGRHYRLTASRSDGATASATVLIPVFESPTMVLSNRFSFPSNPNNPALGLTVGTIQGTRYLAMVLGRTEIPKRCNYPHPIHQEFLPIIQAAATEGDEHRVQLEWPLLRPSYVTAPPPCDEGLGPKRVLAIASGEQWPFDPSVDLRELSHLTRIDNIEGQGIGFLAGVHTRIFPFDKCTPLQRDVACTIRFSPRSSTIVGVIRNGCTGGPVAGAQLQLRAPSTNALRSLTADSSGAFRIVGLEPDVAHSLALVDPVLAFDYLPFEIENIVIGEAAVDTLSLELIHRRNCLPR